MLRVRVGLLDREVVPGVLVVGEGNPAQAEAAAEHGLWFEAVGNTDARRETRVVGLAAQVHRIVAVARPPPGCWWRVVIGEAALQARRGRRIEIVPHAEIDGQFRADLPLVLQVAEEHHGAIGGELDREIALNAGGHIQQEARQAR